MNRHHLPDTWYPGMVFYCPDWTGCWMRVVAGRGFERIWPRT